MKSQGILGDKVKNGVLIIEAFSTGISTQTMTLTIVSGLARI